MIGQTLGHYRILEKVGAGGMGVVYLARDEQLERDVAVKILPPGTLSDDSTRRHFRKEAMALAKLNHPHIETVYDFGTQDGVDYLVMEYLPGKTLADRLATGALPEKEVIDLGMQIASAVEEAHERGIVHRDLKPANIAITAKGYAKILDFGLAKLLRATEEETTEVFSESKAAAGTLPYMPPEQLRGERVDARADIYTTGAVLYEAATDLRPFREELASRLVDAILHQPVVSPRALNPRISPELEAIILKCLDKDRDRRYQSAKELVVDLRRLQVSSTSLPMPLPSRSHPGALRRRIAHAAAAALALVAVLVAFNFSAWRDHLLDHPRTPQIRSLAVLPFENLPGSAEQDYFTEGMTDELITELAKISGLRVISRTSIMRYKDPNRSLPEIAGALRIDAVVEGTVQRIESRVKINARLIQASTDQELWARSYEEDARDVLTLEREVARAIARELQVKLTAKEQAQLSEARPVNPKAHEAYLVGRFYWNKRTAEGLRKSIAYLEEAIGSDPAYALAYAGLADSYHLLPELTTVSASEAFPKARTAALKALDIDASLPEAHSALGNIKEDYDWDWKGAEGEYKRAIELSPGLALAHAWYSNLLLELGRFPEALAEARIAQQLDPLSVFANDNLSAILFYSGEYDQAIEQCRKTLDIDPLSHQAHRHLAQIYAQRRFYGEAVSELRKAIDLSSGGSEAQSEMAYVLAVSGEKQEAHKMLRDMMAGGSPSPYRLAIIYMGLGDHDRALGLLKDAVRQRSPGVVHLKISPLFQPIRLEQRFQELLIDIGLVS
jgi:eukaryotic-like serine/threonine-protein kinase